MQENMGKKTKIRGAGVRALAIYQDMQKIKSNALKQAVKETEALLNKLTKENKLDQETIEILQNVYLGKKRDPVEERMNQTVESFKAEIRQVKSDGVSKLLLTLSSDGDLYRKPKEKFCYPLKKTGQRIAIVRFLINQKNFVSGDEIKDEIQTSYGATTFAISKINTIARHNLDLPEGKLNDLIISRDRGGYKLNPLYPITQEL